MQGVSPPECKRAIPTLASSQNARLIFHSRHGLFSAPVKFAPRAVVNHSTSYICKSAAEICPLASALPGWEISAMKRPESKEKSGNITEGDREDFDYYWQHLRRNLFYVMASAGILWNERAYRDARGWMRRQGKIEHSLFHQRREFEACCLLPSAVSAGIESSDEALREVLKSAPDFFQTAQWQTIKAKASSAEPVAFWNFVGPHGCAWRDYYDGEKFLDKFWKDPRQDYYEHFAFRKDLHHPERHEVGQEFMDLQANLEIKEQEVGDLKRLEYWAKQHQCTVEKERRLKQAECKQARKRMRKFLEAHHRLDFVADTRLPWATVSRAMEAEWNRIKDLRRRVGLAEDEHPPRKREWKKQLEVYDAYFPHWLEHRKKIAALPRIWRENLGFQEAFKLLQVELTPAAAKLARRLDKQGLKPKRIFKHADKFLRALERASYREALSPALSEETKRKIGEQRFFDEQGQGVPVSDFDYEAVDEALDGAEASVKVPRSESGETDQEILQSWRPHFSIPKPQFPPSLAAMSADRRRTWFAVARKRVEATWPTPVPRHSVRRLLT